MQTQIALIVLILAMSAIPSWALDAECSNIKACKFSWQAGPEKDMKEYRMYVRGLLGTYDMTAPAKVIPHPTTKAGSETLPLTPGNYGVVVTAVDTSGNESPISNERTISYTIIDVTPPGAVVLEVTTVPAEIP